jgi:hypothetical protein
MATVGCDHYKLDDSKADHAIAKVYIAANKVVTEKPELKSEVDQIIQRYEAGDPEEIDRNISEFASSLMRYAKGGYIRPPTYLSEGGRKIFRDEIYGRLRFVFLADHAYYRTHGYYDFPQKDYRSRAVNAVMCTLMKIPAFRQEFKKRARTEPARHAEKFFGEAG